jgi:hypothetical protein
MFPERLNIRGAEIDERGGERQKRKDRSDVDLMNLK